MIHGFSYVIMEIYVPKFRIYANLGGNQKRAFVFKTHLSRLSQAKNKKEIEIDDGVGSLLFEHANQETTIIKTLKRILSGRESSQMNQS